MNNISIFSVPIWEKELEIDQNSLQDIRDFCLLLSTTQKSRVISNYGGFQSKDISNTITSKYPMNIIQNHIHKEISNLAKIIKIKPNYKFKLANVWININKKGDYNGLHDHTNSTFSGVIYIAGDFTESCIVFEHPHPIEYFFYKSIVDETSPFAIEEVALKPKPGTMYIFPSWLRHKVPPYKKEDSRISIAFNFGSILT